MENVINNIANAIENVIKPIRVLWLSRHALTREQLEALKRIYGDDVIIKHVTESVTDWAEVVRYGDDCDVLGVVLPQKLLMDLVNPRNNSKPVIRANSTFIPTGKKVVNKATGQLEDERKFTFLGWKLVKRFVLEEEDL